MFKENYIIKGKIVCKTGLHIGGSNDEVNIGGSDNPVIRDSLNGLPYIPGSSLKGKLRSLLELNDRESAQSVIANKGKVSTDKTCIAARLFGVSAEDGNTELKYPTRTIVRDSYPDEKTLELWNETDDLVNGTELKYENTINRIDSSANPRNIERVPRDSKFDFEIIFSVYDGDNENDVISLLEAMKLVEDNYLGGSGSRGYGQIVFDNVTVSKRDSNYYTDNTQENVLVENENIVDAINQLK